MTIILSESAVRDLVDMPLAIEAVTIAFRSIGTGEGRNVPRERLFPPTSSGLATSLQVMAATVPELDAMGLKAYGTGASGANFVVLLFRASTGELRGVVGADWLGRFRTGAATGVAARFLARPNSRVVAILGAGGQAVTQALAVLTAQADVREMRVWNRSEERSRAFRDRLTSVDERRVGDRIERGLSIVPAETPFGAMDGADIVVAITSARTPVLEAAWVRDGMHITGAGINRANVAEIDATAIARADLVVVDHIESARREAGDLILASNSGCFEWSGVVELGSVVSGEHPGRTSDAEVTLFESQGIAAEDVALASLLIDRAEARSYGRHYSFAD